MNISIFQAVSPRYPVFASLVLALFLYGCGGGGSGNNSGVQSGALYYSYQGRQVPVSGVGYATTPGDLAGVTDNAGSWSYQSGDSVSFRIGSRNVIAPAAGSIDQNSLANGNVQAAQNLAMLFRSLDQDGNPANGVSLGAVPSSVDIFADEESFQKQFYKAVGRMPESGFTPSLGINLEAPQGEADSAGQAMPFVDIFRTARPFSELFAGGTTVITDANGWPANILPVENNIFARTKMLQGVPKGALPDGDYTLLYEGSGEVEANGAVITSIRPLTPQNGVKGRVLNLQFFDSADAEANVVTLIVRATNPDVKNIRLVMPGGTCRSNDTLVFNHLLRVDSQADCPANSTWISFAERLRNNRNEIIFNPQYLAFLKNFRTLRMMNFMEASHGISACQNGLIIDQDCVDEPLLWSNRATLDEAVWGGSSRTAHELRRGVPVEVMVELANQLEIHPWFNMPHSADDNYIRQFAQMVATRLKGNLKPHIEYSNEVWNAGFLGHHYVNARGLEAGLDSVPAEFQSSRSEQYFARLRWYSRRSVDIFDIWEDEFGGSQRLVRIMGSFQGDKVLSEQLLVFENASASVDALAIAPYFFGCVDNEAGCANAPATLSEVQSVNEIFDIIDQPFPTDPNALDATLFKIAEQANIAARNGVQLFAYEGGQHLTIMSSLGSLPEARKEELRDLFKAANRDPRMKQRYLSLLNAWQSHAAQGTGLFSLYTGPQTFYRFGNWGIKEHLGKTRAESPKFDAAMTFQETAGQCWWGNCR